MIYIFWFLIALGGISTLAALRASIRGNMTAAGMAETNAILWFILATQVIR